MSLEIIPPFSSPSLKRTSESISLFPDGVSKCGELFVTNTADKWTFFCGYCQEVTNDIGVFICHIRLEHLNVHTDLAQKPQQSRHTHQAERNISTIVTSSQSGADLSGVTPNIQSAIVLPCEEQHPQSEIIKEEETLASTGDYFRTNFLKVSKIDDIASLTEPVTSDRKTDIVNKNLIPTSQHTSAKIEDFFTITSTDVETQQQGSSSEIVNKEVVQVVYVNEKVTDKNEYNANFENETTENDQDDDDNTLSCYSPSDNDEDDDADFEIVDSDETTTSSKSKRRKRALTDSADSDLRFKCPYCPTRYKNKNSITAHISLNHRHKLTIKCKICNRALHSKSGLKIHLKSHDENTLVVCPICPTKHTENQFITHVLTHESDKCFPCQVCGKVYVSNKVRMTHWETHAKEKPFACPLCYRRYHKRAFLARHLSIHKQYRCHSCLAKFNTTETQRPPYICSACEKLSGAKGKADDVKQLTDEHSSAVLKPAVQHNENKQIGKEIKKFGENNLEDSDDDNNSEIMSYYIPSDDEYFTNLETNDARITRNSIIENTNTAVAEKSDKCSYCNERFLNIAALNTHLIQIHDGKNLEQLTFKCKVCHVDFKTYADLKLHSKSHNKNDHFQCPICSTKHKKDNFITHVLTHETDTCFPCQVCAKIFTTNKDRVAHWNTHATEKPFVCKICYQRFRKKQYLTNHFKIHNQYQCHFCPVVFNASESQCPPYVCHSCEKYPNIKQTVEHLKSLAHDSDEAVITETKLTDDIVVSENNTINLTNEDSNTHCSYSLNDNNDGVLNDVDSDLEIIDDHVPSSSNASTSITTNIINAENVDSLLFKCQYCNREFISERGLVVHTSKMHDKNGQFFAQFICRYCNRTFQTRSGLALHYKTHDKRNQFHCPLCPLTEFRESSFITHVLLHESESCFPCQVCAKILPTNEERMKHWKTHLEERPHGCNLCYRRFYKSHVLKNHMKSHGLYYCHFCTDHINSVETLHPPYACSKCEKLSDVQRKVKQRKHSSSKNQVFDSDEED